MRSEAIVSLNVAQKKRKNKKFLRQASESIVSVSIIFIKVKNLVLAQLKVSYF
jgi:hypothetical protein